MAVSLSFNISLSSDAKTLTITDTTGQYSSTNTGGWGSFNPDLNTALTAVMQLSKRNADGTFGTTTSIDMFPTLPSDSEGAFDITATLAGQGITFSDGIYRLKYIVSGNNGGISPYNLSITRYDTLRNSISCCGQKMAAKVATCNCNCKSIESKYREFSIFYRLLKAAECCGDLNAIQKYLDKLTEMCSDTDCGC